MSCGPDRSTITPSRAHETRRTFPENIGDAGGVHPTNVAARTAGARPAVLRVYVDRAGLFLGKAHGGTVRPDSADRLRDYLRWLLPPCERTVGSVLAVAHPRGLGRPWRHCVDWLCQGPGDRASRWQCERDPKHHGHVRRLRVVRLAIRPTRHSEDRTQSSQRGVTARHTARSWATAFVARAGRHLREHDEHQLVERVVLVIQQRRAVVPLQEFDAAPCPLPSGP